MTLEQIKDAVKTLPESEFCELRFWMNEYDDDEFDKQIKRDFDEGRLDALLAEVDGNDGKSYSPERERYIQAVDDSLADAVNRGFFDEMAKAAIEDDEAGKTTPMFPWKHR